MESRDAQSCSKNLVYSFQQEITISDDDFHPSSYAESVARSRACFGDVAMKATLDFDEAAVRRIEEVKPVLRKNAGRAEADPRSTPVTRSHQRHPGCRALENLDT